MIRLIEYYKYIKFIIISVRERERERFFVVEIRNKNYYFNRVLFRIDLVEKTRFLDV